MPAGDLGTGQAFPELAGNERLPASTLQLLCSDQMSGTSGCIHPFGMQSKRQVNWIQVAVRALPARADLPGLQQNYGCKRN
jgi:hypothetical protein